jgi:hypothetical protein
VIAGQFNTTGNLVASEVSTATLNATGFINTLANVSAAVVNAGALNATGTTTLAAVNSSGFIQTTGNISGAVVNAGALNATGTTTLAAVNSSGLINTTANISAAVIDTGALNSTGLINTTGNISGATVNAGQFNTTGNLSASQVSTATLKASGLTSGRVVFTSTDGLLVDNAGITFTANTLTVGGALPITIDGDTATIATTTTNQDLILAPNGNGNIDASSSQIINVADPTSAQDAVTKSYLETQLSSAVTNLINDNSSIFIYDTGANGRIEVTVDGDLVGNITQDITTLTNDVKVSNTTVSTTTTSGALVVTGGVGIGGQLTGAVLKSTDTTQSTSTTTGAIITAGGLGVAKNLNVGGDATVTGNLTVQGVLTAIESTTLEVNDLQITLAKGAGTSAAADGAGINVDYGNVGANITYTHATLSWNFNKPIIGSSYANFGGNVLATNFVGGGVNVSGNVLAAQVSTGTLNATGLINTLGNISAAVIDTGALNSTGFINTSGNISAATVIAGQFNTTGNLSASQVSTATLNATGLINTLGNISASQVSTATLNATGLINTLGNISAAVIDTGALNSTGFINTTANVSAAIVNTGALNATGTVTLTGFLNSSANISAAVVNTATLNATGTTTLVAVNSTGFINTTANISAAVVNTDALNATGTTTLAAVNSSGFINTTGNISAAVLNGGAINSTGFINTTGNISGAVVNAGALNATGTTTLVDVNSTGFINTTANVSAAVVNTGALNATGTTTLVAVNSSGLINTTGNISASRINADTLAATGTVYANATTDSTSLTTGALITFGGAAVTKSVVIGDGLLVNSAQGAKTFQVKGQGNNALIVADAAKNAIVFSTTGNTTVTDGCVVKFDSTGAIQVPVGSTALRPGSTGNVDLVGMLRFNSTTTNLEFCTASGSPGTYTAAGSVFTIITTNSFNGNGVQTVFTLSTASTTAGTIVAVNGVVQIPSTAYSVTGTTLTFTEAPAPGDVIDARVLITTATVSAIASASGYNQFDVSTEPYANITAGAASPTVRMSINGTNGTATFTNDVVINGNLTVKGGSSGNINIGDQSTDIINLQGEIVYDQTALTAIGTNLRQLDSFSTDAYHTAKYLFQIRDGANIESGEVLLAQDGVNVEITTYAVLAPGGVLGTFQSNISSGQVRWFYTPGISTYANIKVQSTYIV